MILTDQEVERYARQVVMPEIGEVGQKKLLDAKVLILGAGGLGAPVIAGLAGAGVGHLTVICLLYTSPSPRDLSTSRMPSSA